MRFLIQRVTSAKVTVAGKTIGEIDQGLVVLIGVGREDNEQIADKMIRKLTGLRIFADENGKDVCWFTLYRGLLVARDGMYNLEVRYTTPLDREALTIGIGEKDYVRGKSTAQELVDAGWAWEQESDGTFGFTPEEGSWFYVETEDGTLEGAIVSVNLLWAYTGLSFRYCGCTDENSRLWSWLEEDLGGAPTEEGAMTAYANLTDGGAVRIETKDSRPLLTLIR